MNVIEISGDDGNPSIWGFFVAVSCLCCTIMLIVGISVWIQMVWMQHRKAGMKDVLKHAFGVHASSNKPKKTATVVIDT